MLCAHIENRRVIGWRWAELARGYDEACIGFDASRGSSGFGFARGNSLARRIVHAVNRHAAWQRDKYAADAAAREATKARVREWRRKRKLAKELEREGRTALWLEGKLVASISGAELAVAKNKARSGREHVWGVMAHKQVVAWEADHA
jgi:phage protein D